MKKLIGLLTLLLILTGCSSSSVKVSDGDTVLWKGPKETYTKQDLFDDMKNNDYSTTIALDVVMDICAADGNDLTEAKDNYDAQYDSYYSMLGSYAEYYMGTRDAFISSSIYSYVLNTYLTEDINNDFDSYVEKYSPVYAEIFYVDTEDASKAIVDAVNNGTNTLEYAAAEQGYSSEITNTVYLDDSDLPVDVKDILNSAEGPELTTAAVDTYETDSEGNTTTTTRYYIINIVSKDASEFKDEFISAVVADTDSTEYIQGMINEHDVRFYDQSSYDYFSSVFEGAK